MARALAALALLSAALLVVADEDELKINRYLIPAGCADAPRTAAGDSLTVHYTGKVAATGKEFDSSKDRDPFSFTLGAGKVIGGWDDGLQSMCAGEKRRLTVPPSLGYGEQGAGDGVIPRSAVLLFDVELVSFMAAAEPLPDRFALADTDGDGLLQKGEISTYLAKEGEESGPELDESAALIVADADSDGDGALSKAEFHGEL